MNRWPDGAITALSARKWVNSHSSWCVIAHDDGLFWKGHNTNEGQKQSNYLTLVSASQHTQIAGGLENPLWNRRSRDGSQAENKCAARLFVSGWQVHYHRLMRSLVLPPLQTPSLRLDGAHIGACCTGTSKCPQVFSTEAQHCSPWGALREQYCGCNLIQKITVLLWYIYGTMGDN